MKKEVNSFAVAIVILCGLLCAALIWFRYLDTKAFVPHEIYPTSMIVVEVDYENDLVTIADFEGRAYQFYGCEDWYENDICAVIMDDNGTSETVYDDIILQTRYCGYVE